MNVSDSTRRYIVLGLAFFVLMGLISATVMGNKQDKAFQNNNVLYGLMTQQLQEGNYSDALVAAEVLGESQKSSEVVNYFTALAAINAGETDKALMHMQRALDINPHKVEDSMFMLQYAEMLVQSEKKDEATQVLERCEVLPVPELFPNYKERILQLQDQLATQM